MRRRSMLLLGAALMAGCASPAPEAGEVPLCGAPETRAPVADDCAPDELRGFEQTLAREVVPRASRALVRVEFDDAARVRAACVEPGPGYDARSAQRALAEHLDAVLALPPGPACVAGRRIDLNRYEAKWAEVHERDVRCSEQTRVTRETQGPTTVRDRTVRGNYGVYDQEYEWCMEYEADWIALDQPGSMRPVIYVEPEVPNRPALSAYDTASRCMRKSRVFEKRAACIEGEGWERLDPPAR